MPLYVSDKQIVLPGDAVATKDYNISGSVYWDGDVATQQLLG